MVSIKNWLYSNPEKLFSSQIKHQNLLSSFKYPRCLPKLLRSTVAQSTSRLVDPTPYYSQHSHHQEHLQRPKARRAQWRTCAWRISWDLRSALSLAGTGSTEIPMSAASLFQANSTAVLLSQYNSLRFASVSRPCPRRPRRQ